eukprot:scaffold119685_cov72-Phaeocystis_antarctica.AAC.1
MSLALDRRSSAAPPLSTMPRTYHGTRPSRRCHPTGALPSYHPLAWDQAFEAVSPNRRVT